MGNSFERMRRRNLENSPGNSGCLKFVIPLAAVAIVLLILNVLFVERVPFNESCAITSFGQVQTNADGSKQYAGPGLHIMSPDKQLVCFNTQRKTMELVEGDPAQSNSKADYVDYAIKGRTSDGVDLYSMLTMQYQVPVACAGQLLPTVVNDEGVKEQIVKARLRSIVPQAISKYDAATQYKGNIASISDEIQEQLDAELEAQCVDLVLFELKRGDFADSYEAIIAKQNDQRAATEQSRLAQETANEEAKRVAIEAETAANKAKTEADAAAYVKRTNTDAVVYDLTERAKALEENPSLIEWEQTQAIRDAGAVYLPSGALPIYNVPEPTPPPAG